MGATANSPAPSAIQGFVLHQRSADVENRRSQFQIIARFTDRDALAAAHARQKLLRIARPGNFRKGPGHTGQRMRIAAADHRLADSGRAKSSASRFEHVSICPLSVSTP